MATRYAVIEGQGLHDGGETVRPVYVTSDKAAAIACAALWQGTWLSRSTSGGYVVVEGEGPWLGHEADRLPRISVAGTDEEGMEMAKDLAAILETVRNEPRNGVVRATDDQGTYYVTSEAWVARLLDPKDATWQDEGADVRDSARHLGQQALRGLGSGPGSDLAVQYHGELTPEIKAHRARLADETAQDIEG